MKSRIRHFAVAACALAILFAAEPARADSVYAPDTYGGDWSIGGWYFGCEFEYYCYDYFNPDLNYASTVLEYGTVDGTVTATGPAADQYVYGEVDDSSGNPTDFTVFNINGYPTGPVVFTFTNPDGSPMSVAGFGTMIYGDLENFTATVTALNAAGEVLGTETYTAADYQSFAGIGYADGLADIASVVISTDDNEFGFGTVGVAPAPEPATFALILIALACVQHCSPLRRLSIFSTYNTNLSVQLRNRK